MNRKFGCLKKIHLFCVVNVLPSHVQISPRIHPVEYGPVIKSRLALRNELYGLTWCESGHVAPGNPPPTKPSYSTVWFKIALKESNTNVGFLHDACPLSPRRALPRLTSDDVFQETSARYRAVEPSSGSNVIPRRARPGLAGLRPYSKRERGGDLAPRSGIL